MSTTPPGSIPDEQRDRLHAYLASFLSPAAADEALIDVAAAHGPEPADLVALLGTAHRVLHARVEVPTELEAAVLVEDLGVDVAAVATVLGVPQDRLRSTVDPDATPRVPAPRTDRASADEVVEIAGGPGSPRARRRGRIAVAILIVAFAGVAVAVALLTGEDTGIDSACEATATAPVCVASARLTDVVDPSGAPGASRDRFAVGEPVKLWFRYDTVDGLDDRSVTYVWFREGDALLADEITLPPGQQVNLTLAGPFAQQPGDYRVVVRRGDDVLVDESFTIR